MSMVGALAQTTAAARLRRSGRLGSAGQFHVADDGDPQVPATGTTAGPAPIGLHGLLALQEAAADAVQDREARRHAGSMLSELTAMQRAMLQDDRLKTSAALTRLADLARQSSAAVDPRLAAVVRAIAMRAAVEAARSRRD